MDRSVAAFSRMGKTWESLAYEEVGKNGSYGEYFRRLCEAHVLSTSHWREGLTSLVHPKLNYSYRNFGTELTPQHEMFVALLVPVLVDCC